MVLIKMETITKPSLTRIARRAGVKSLSDDCFDAIRNFTEPIEKRKVESIEMRYKDLIEPLSDKSSKSRSKSKKISIQVLPVKQKKRVPLMQVL